MSLPGALSPAFADLLGFRVQEVLFALNQYDAFILAEDSQLNERVFSGLKPLSAQLPPSVTQVTSGAEALERLARHPGRYELVIASPHLGDMDIGVFAGRLREQGRTTPVTPFGYDSRSVQDMIRRYPGADFEAPFVWQGDAGIFPAIVNQVEDRRNAPHDTGVSGVPAILLVEDSIRYYSSFLPQVHQAVFEQVESLVREGVSPTEKTHRIRSRPKILLASDYETAWESFLAYPDQVLGIISDIEFPRGGRLDPCAGERFARAVRESRPDIPVILHSQQPENEALAKSVGADFLLKGSANLLRQVRRLIRERFHFGDFVFRAPGGEEVARATDLDSFEREIARAPRESVLHHARKNEISHWLMARGELELARLLRAVRIADYAPEEDIGADVAQRLRRRRRERGLRVVADFPADRFEPGEGFHRIGSGSVGGKGRGLAFTNSLLERSGIADRYPKTRIAVPQTVVLATGVFERFMEENELLDFAESAGDEAEIHRRFQAGRFPEDAENDLRRYAEAVRYPVAARSSSLLEDSPFQPFSGVYETYLLPNRAETPDERLRRLLAAVKRVYASLFAPRVKRFLDGTPYRLEEERMAVILQQVVGLAHGDRFYPDIAGTARSRNAYPIAPLEADDGIATVALGLGAHVTDGGAAVSFAPKRPEVALRFGNPADRASHSQTDFLALSLEGDSEDGFGMIRTPLARAEADGVLGRLASTWSAEDDALREGISRPGARLVTLAPLLGEPDDFPLAAILTELLDLGVEACRSPVELEFAANLSVPRGRRREFGFVQLRRLETGRAGEREEDAGPPSPERILCRSPRVLGRGRVEGISRLVVVDRSAFDRGKSLEAAREIARLNARLTGEGESYLLIGVGRLGSRDRHLGIPVSWDQVSGARVIVETGFRDLVVEPSQGTHFFDNLVSHGVGYFTVNPDRGDGELDWDWLLAQPAEKRPGAVRLIRLSDPLEARLPGGEGEGFILKPAHQNTKQIEGDRP